MLALLMYVSLRVTKRNSLNHRLCLVAPSRFGAKQHIDDVHAELVHMHHRSVSIICVSVCAYPDLSGHSLHKHPRWWITVGAKSAVAPSVTSFAHGSVFGKRSLRHDETYRYSPNELSTRNWKPFDPEL